MWASGRRVQRSDGRPWTDEELVTREHVRERWESSEHWKLSRAHSDALNTYANRVHLEHRTAVEEKVARDHAIARRAERLSIPGPLWDGPGREWDVVNRDVLVQTPDGERVGRVVYFGIREEGGSLVKDVLVYSPASGSLHCVPGRDLRLASAADAGLLAQAAADAAARAEARRDEPSSHERRTERTKAGALLDQMLDAVHALQLAVEEKAGFHKIVRSRGTRRIYLAKKGGRADLSGFSIEHPAVAQLTREQARERHLGQVRGQVDFSRSAEEIMDAWARALAELD